MGVRVVKREAISAARTTAGAQTQRARPNERTPEQRLETLYRDAQRLANRVKFELEERRRNGIR